MKRREFLVSAAAAAAVTGGATPATAKPADGSTPARPSSTRKILIAGGNFDTPYIRYMAELTGKPRPKLLYLPTATPTRPGTRLVPQLFAVECRGVAPGQLHRQHAAAAQLGEGPPLGGRHRLLGRQHPQPAGDLDGPGHRSDPAPGLGSRHRARRGQRRLAVLVRGRDDRLTAKGPVDRPVPWAC